MIPDRDGRPAIDHLVPTIVYGALVFFLLSSAIFVRMSTAIRVGYALCAAVALGLPLLLLLSTTPPERRVRNGALIAAGCSSLFLIPAAIAPQGRQLLQVLVDFCTTLLPLGFLVIVLTVPATLERLLARRWALAFWLTALWAPLVIETPEYARAFEPPDVGVIALLTTLALRAPRGRDRAFSAVGLLALAALAGMSGSRSVFLIAMLACALSVLTHRAARRVAAVALIAAILVGLFNLDLIRRQMNTEGDAGTVPRALTFIQAGRGDLSTSNRLREMRIVNAEMREGSPVSMVFGAGHGAVIEPLEWHSPRTISEDGYVHNVHFGPQLMLFRYGVAGLALYVILLVHAIAVTWRCLRERAPPSLAGASRLLFALGTTLYLFEFAFRSVLPNPVFSFFLAGHIGLAIQASARNSARKRPQTTA